MSHQSSKQHLEAIQRRINYLKERIKVRHESHKAYGAEVSELKALDWAMRKLAENFQKESDNENSTKTEA